jgi:hypothetical protein
MDGEVDWDDNENEDDNSNADVDEDVDEEEDESQDEEECNEERDERVQTAVGDDSSYRPASKTHLPAEHDV